MALHSEGKHGWGSASMPATIKADASHCVEIAERLATELERLGAIAPGWTVPAERAADGSHDLSIRIGEEFVWIVFPLGNTLKSRRPSMRVPRAALTGD